MLMPRVVDLHVGPGVHDWCTGVHVQVALHPSRSLVEASRAAPFMVDRKHVDTVIADHEVDPIRESANARATHSIVMESV